MATNTNAEEAYKQHLKSGSNEQQANLYSGSNLYGDEPWFNIGSDQLQEYTDNNPVLGDQVDWADKLADGTVDTGTGTGTGSGSGSTADGNVTVVPSVGGSTSTSTDGTVTSTSSGSSVASWADKLSDSVYGSEDYQAAKAALQANETAKPGYTGTYEEDKQNAYDKIVNREEFSYNMNDDALYQQYADRYMQQGREAMMDTMGQAAALTGGYGSTYSQKTGQETYDQYLQSLGDVALDMYDRAYSRYQDEGDALMDKYSLAGDMADTEYGRYQDELTQWNNDRSYYADQESQIYDRLYNEQADAYNQQLEEASIAAQYGDFTGFAALFGEERAAQLQQIWNTSNPDAAYNAGYITADEYKAMTGKYPKGYNAASSGGSSYKTTKFGKDGTTISYYGGQWHSSNGGIVSHADSGNYSFTPYSNVTYPTE